MEGTATTAPDVEAWVAAAAAGDTQARHRLLEYVNERFRRLVSYQLKQFPAVRRWEETDDVLQEVLIRLNQALERTALQDSRHFLALSGRLIRNELIDLARHYTGPEGHGRHHVSEAACRDGSDAGALRDMARCQTYDGGGLAEWTEYHRQVDALPAELKEVATLIWYHELSHEEAARILGVSTKSVQRRWREVRLQIGNWLNQ